MALSSDIRQKLVEILQERIGRIRPCPVCGQDEEFNLTPAIVNLQFNETSNSMSVGDQYATNLVLVCGKCGCTHLLNAGVLGALDVLPQSGQATTMRTEEAAPTNGNVTDV